MSSSDSTPDVVLLSITDAVAFGLLGLSSWLLVSGIYTVVASFSDVLPEGYDISVYLVSIQALSNIVPAILQVVLPSSVKPRLLTRLVWVNLIIGFITCVLGGIFWDQTVNDYSVCLYMFMFMAGALASATNITHFSLVARYEKRCALYYTFGLGIGGSLVGVLGLFQSRGLFTVDTFFYAFIPIYLCSMYGFSHISRKENSIPISTSEAHLSLSSPLLKNIDVNIREDDDPSPSMTDDKSVMVPPSSGGGDTLHDKEDVLSLAFSLVCAKSISYQSHLHDFPDSLPKIRVILFQTFIGGDTSTKVN